MTTNLQYIPISNDPFLYINDIKSSNNATTPNTKIDLDAGICRDQSNACDINIGNYLGANPNITSNTSTTIDATVTGINGLDTGALAASTVYYIYVVANVLDQSYTPGAVLSTTAPSTGPIMPANYNVYRHVGYAVTDASVHFLLFNQSGNNNARTFLYQSQQLALNAGTATSYTAVTLTAFVPTLENVPVYAAGYLTPNAAGDTLKIQASGNSGDGIIIYGQVAAVVTAQINKVMARLSSSVPKIAYKVSTGSASAQINVAGFDFYI